MRVLLCFELLRIFKILPNYDSSRQKKKNLDSFSVFNFFVIEPSGGVTFIEGN